MIGIRFTIVSILFIPNVLVFASPRKLSMKSRVDVMLFIWVETRLN